MHGQRRRKTNAGTDYLFLSLDANGKTVGSTTCASGCIYNYDITSGSATGTPADALQVAGGSGSIVIDNSGSATGESQVYYGSLSSQTCVATVQWRPAVPGRAQSRLRNQPSNSKISSAQITKRGKLMNMIPQDEKDRKPALAEAKSSTRRPYVKPQVRHERVFETQALSCGKVSPVQGTCSINRKNS